MSPSDAAQVEVESEITSSSEKLNCSENENCKTPNKTYEVSKPISLTEFGLGGNKTICDGDKNINMEWELVRNLNSLSGQLATGEVTKTLHFFTNCNV